eukprot:10729876-Prorocentrum_lima.AAC.1
MLRRGLRDRFRKAEYPGRFVSLKLSRHPKGWKPRGERKGKSQKFPNHEDGKEEWVIPEATLKSTTDAEGAREDLPDGAKAGKAKSH